MWVGIFIISFGRIGSWFWKALVFIQTSNSLGKISVLSIKALISLPKIFLVQVCHWFGCIYILGMVHNMANQLTILHYFEGYEANFLKHCDFRKRDQRDSQVKDSFRALLVNVKEKKWQNSCQGKSFENKPHTYTIMKQNFFYTA